MTKFLPVLVVLTVISSAQVRGALHAQYYVYELNGQQDPGAYDLEVMQRLPEWADFIDSSEITIAGWIGYYAPLYVVDDPDGKVNVRAEPTTDSKVVAQLPSGSLVLAQPTPAQSESEDTLPPREFINVEWINVEWSSDGEEEPQRGFIHASRLSHLDQWEKFKASQGQHLWFEDQPAADDDRIRASVEIAPELDVLLEFPACEKSAKEGRVLLAVLDGKTNIAVPPAQMRILNELSYQELLQAMKTITVFKHPNLPWTVVGVDIPGCCCGHSKMFWAVAGGKFGSSVLVYSGI